jgi:hypothetical protein
MISQKEIKMKKAILIAASLAFLSAPALAQGGSPYNDSGSQAGGPAGGMGRRMGSSKAEDPSMVMPPRGSAGTTAAAASPRKSMGKAKPGNMKMKHSGKRNHSM